MADLTPTELYGFIYNELLDIAQRAEFVDDNTIIPELVPYSKAFVLKWLECDEFKDTFKGNATRYYFGIATNALVGGMYYAKVYCKSPDKISEIQFDDIYNGGLWKNVYELLEDPTDASSNQFKLMTSDMFNIWSKSIKPYFSKTDAALYLTDTLTAFFHVGIAIEYTILGI